MYVPPVPKLNWPLDRKGSRSSNASEWVICFYWTIAGLDFYSQIKGIRGSSFLALIPAFHSWFFSLSGYFFHIFFCFCTFLCTLFENGDFLGDKVWKREEITEKRTKEFQNWFTGMNFFITAIELCHRREKWFSEKLGGF